MRIIALDYGSKTVGVAVSDELGLTALPLETIKRDKENKLRKTLARIEEIIKERSISLIVLGKPLNMDDSEGERVKKTLEFAAALEKRTGLKVVLQDERLSSIEAKEILADSGIKKEDMKLYIDSVAASVILREFMNTDKER
jgi:RNAse H domain protein, YqgF family